MFPFKKLGILKSGKSGIMVKVKAVKNKFDAILNVFAWVSFFIALIVCTNLSAYLKVYQLFPALKTANRYSAIKCLL